MSTVCFVCWIAALLVTAATDCPPLRTPNHGLLRITVTQKHTSLWWPPGTLIRYSCRSGYYLEGEKNRMCTPGGQWSGEEPLCLERTCPEPEELVNGNYQVVSNRITGIVTYSCRRGYRRVGRRVQKCQKNYQWTRKDFPRCEQLSTCDDPGYPTNGDRHGDCCYRGDVLNFTCFHGTQMVGERISRCLGDGTWSNSVPQCQGEVFCSDPEDFEHGTFVSRKEHQIYMPGDWIAYRCDRGHILSSYIEDKLDVLNMTCQSNGHWDNMKPSCLDVRCASADVIAPQNGSVVNASLPDFLRLGDTVEYACAQGFDLIGPRVRHCMENGKLSLDEPICRRSACVEPEAPEFGMKYGTSFNVGDVISFACYGNYELHGSQARMCRPNHRWSGTLTTCQDRTKNWHCPNPGIPVGGYKEGREYNRGATVRFTCRPGFVLYGSQERVCQADGRWSGTETRCEAPHSYDLTEEVKQRFGPAIDTLAQNTWSSPDMRERRLRHGTSGETLGDLVSQGVDLYLAFDVSGSIRSEEVKRAVRFAIALVHKLGVSSRNETGGTLVAAMTFGNVSRIIFNTDKYDSEELVVQDLKRIHRTGGGTNMQKALDTVKKMILHTRQHFRERQGFSKTAVMIFSDGEYSVGGDPQYKAHSLKSKLGAEIFCVGVRSGMTLSQSTKPILANLASQPPETHMFFLKQSQEYDILIEEMLNKSVDYSACGETNVEDLESVKVMAQSRDGTWPWMAGLNIGDAEEADLETKRRMFTLRCGAALVDAEWVVTAGHCVRFDHSRVTPNKIYVRLGTVLNPTGDRRQMIPVPAQTQDLEVDYIKIHEQYQRISPYDNDIALLHLKTPAQLTVNVRTVCLPTQADAEQIYGSDKIGWVTGWGHSGRVAPNSPYQASVMETRMKQLQIPQQSNSVCEHSLQKLGKSRDLFTQSMYCAGQQHYGTHNGSYADACDGDSGGPMVVPLVDQQTKQTRWVLAGIVSHGFACAYDEVYTFYTKVALFTDWITRNVEKWKEWQM